MKPMDLQPPKILSKNTCVHFYAQLIIPLNVYHFYMGDIEKEILFIKNNFSQYCI